MTERYPSRIELRQIKNWKKSYSELIDFVGSIWAYHDWGWAKRGRTYHVSTAGWSGNEEIIHALKENKNYFWGMCWYSSRRGGHYIFKVPKHTVGVRGK